MADRSLLLSFDEQNPYYDPRAQPPSVPPESMAAQNWTPIPAEEAKMPDLPQQASQPAQPPTFASEGYGEGPQGGIPTPPQAPSQALIEDKNAPKPSKFQSFIEHPATQGILKAIAAAGFGMNGQGMQFLEHVHKMQESDLDRQATVFGLQMFSKASAAAAKGDLGSAEGIMDQALQNPRVAKAMPDMVKRFEALIAKKRQGQATAQFFQLKGQGMSTAEALQRSGLADVMDPNMLAELRKEDAEKYSYVPPTENMPAGRFNRSTGSIEYDNTAAKGDSTEGFSTALQKATAGDPSALATPGLSKKELDRVATILSGKTQGLHFTTQNLSDGVYAIGMDPRTGDIKSKVRIGDKEFAPSIDREIIAEADRRGLQGPDRMAFINQQKAAQAATREAAVQGERPLTDTTQKEIVGYNNILSAVKELEKFSPQEVQAYSGLVNRPLADAKNAVAGMFGKGADQRFLQFKTLMGRMQAEAFAVGGKQLTPFEYSIVTQFTPTGREPGGAAEVQAKLQSFKLFTTIKRDVTLDLARSGRSYVDPEEMDMRIKQRMQELGIKTPQVIPRGPGGIPMPPPR